MFPGNGLLLAQRQALGAIVQKPSQLRLFRVQAVLFRQLPGRPRHQQRMNQPLVGQCFAQPAVHLRGPLRAGGNAVQPHQADILHHLRLQSNGFFSRSQCPADLRRGHVPGRQGQKPQLCAAFQKLFINGPPFGFLGGAAADDELAQGEYLIRIAPVGQIYHGVLADDVKQLRIPKPLFHQGQGVHRINGSLPFQLHARRLHAGQAEDGQTGHFVAVLRVGQLLMFMRRVAGGQKNHPIQLIFLPGALRHFHVAFMDGIEAAPHDADPFPFQGLPFLRWLSYRLLPFIILKKPRKGKYS